MHVGRIGLLVTIAALLATGVALTACSGTERSSEEFCERLGEFTGRTGAESALVPGDPARVDAVLDELRQLDERAPEEMSVTTRTLVTFFEDYQRASRDERRDVIAANEASLAQASVALNDYALGECGLILSRIPPTPIPTANPSIDAAND